MFSSQPWLHFGVTWGSLKNIHLWASPQEILIFIGLGLVVHWEFSKLPGWYQDATKVKNCCYRL